MAVHLTQCPYCRETERALRQTLDKYGDQVRLVYKDFPLGVHKHAMDAALGAAACPKPGVTATAANVTSKRKFRDRVMLSSLSWVRQHLSG